MLEAPFALSTILKLMDGNEYLKKIFIENSDKTKSNLEKINFPSTEIYQLCLELGINNTCFQNINTLASVVTIRTNLVATAHFATESYEV